MPIGNNCIDETVIATIQRLFQDWTLEQLVNHSIQLNLLLIPFLYKRFQIPFTLTAGWFEVGPKRAFYHDESYLKRLISGMDPNEYMEGLHLHFWLTSAAMEIIDISLPYLLPSAIGKEMNRVIHCRNNEPNPAIIYHPMVVGSEFLEKIGSFAESSSVAEC